MMHTKTPLTNEPMTQSRNTPKESLSPSKKNLAMKGFKSENVAKDKLIDV
jgi:hypothetical protein